MKLGSLCLYHVFWKSLQKMVHFCVILKILACCYNSFLLFYFFKESKMCSAYSVPCLQKIRFSFTQQVFKGSVMPVGLSSLWCFPSNTGELSLDSFNSLSNFITNFNFYYKCNLLQKQIAFSCLSQTKGILLYLFK